MDPSSAPVPPEANERAPLAPSEIRSAIVAVVVAALAVAIALASIDVWLGNDAPAHLFNAYAHAHIDDVTKGYARYLEVTWPLTSRGFLELFLVFEPLLGWRGAYRAVLIVIAELWGLGFFALVVAVAPARWPVGLLGFATALSWPLDMGFFSFCLAVALAFWTIAFWIRAAHSGGFGGVSASIRSLVVVAAAMYVVARVHVFPAMLGGIALAVIEGARAPVGRKLRRLAALALAGAPSAIVAGLASNATTDFDVEQRWGTLLERLGNVAMCTVAGPWWRSTPLVALAIASLILLWSRRRTATPIDMALGGLGVVACSLAIAMPLHLSWQFYGPRFAPFGLLLLVAALPIEKLGERSKSIAAVALLAYVIAAAAWSSSYHRGLVERAAPVFASMTAAPSTVRRMPIMLPTEADAAPAVRYAEPMRQLGQVVAIELGGISAYGFFMSSFVFSTALKPGVVDDLAPIPPSAWIEEIELRPGAKRDAQLTRIAHGAQRFDELFIFGSTADLELFTRSGYAPIVPPARDGDRVAMRARFQGCQGVVHVDGPPDTVATLELGWWPLRLPDLRLSGTIPADGHLELPVDGAGCGALWIAATGGRCANATDGRVSGPIAQGLRCAYVPGP